MRTIHFFLDFDGTISTSDAVDLVLERFADKEWKKIEKEWTDGNIGSRECLARQVALIRATPEELHFAVSQVKLDVYFLSFLKKAEELGVLVTIVSDGFDIIIEQVLKQNLQNKSGVVKGMPIFSNQLQKTTTGFKAVFSTEAVCDHGCANCKQAVIKKMTSPGDHIFFVGDGLSDRFAARQAHLTFAKGKLLTYCQENKIDHIAFKDFKKIQQWLEENHAFLRKVQDGQR